MLSTESLLALILFAFVSSFTPGPNNLMLLASGVNFGFVRTLPHMLGVGLGFAFMVFLVGIGFAQLFTLFPWLQTILKIVGSLYMIWLAFNIARAGGIGETAGKARPMTFLEAAAFQWVNPKAWVMALYAIGAYTVSENFYFSVVVVAVVFGIVNLPSVGSWAMFGVGLRQYLSSPRAVRIFNITMAVLLVASLWPILAEFTVK